MCIKFKYFSSTTVECTNHNIFQECSPTAIRGFLTFTAEIGYAAMTLLGMFLGMESIWGNDLRKLLFAPIVPSLVAVFVLLPLPETPKFLFIVRGDKKAAINSIHFYQGSSVNAETVINEISQVWIVKRENHFRGTTIPWRCDLP
ncbi:sugar transporter domain-containing protein [Ditylenchus destructor]|uniref:Sugar transporter domain-containing protein n=1 Tax=Ditylenchus destructor TaxID=166010 RepID=A0AAD4NA71_9BILA|nr:sugar transporter domain-containing protein [Ditylenchus destructor]